MALKGQALDRNGYAPNFSLAVGSLCLSLVIFLLIRAEVQRTNQSLDVARAQLVALPIYLLSFYLIARCWLRRAWILVCVPIVLTVGVNFWTAPIRSSSGMQAYMGMLEGDTFGSSTQIIFDLLKAHAKFFDAKINYQLLNRKIDDAQVDKLLSESPSNLVVIDGSPQWISLRFNRSEPISLSTARWLTQFADLKILATVPNVGMSYQPVLESAKYIVSLLDGSEASLLLSGSLNAQWSATSHRAYPYMLLGVEAFRSALNSSSYQPALMDCAADNFYKAWLLASSKDNLELKASVTNNLGVVWFIQGVMEDSKALRREGLDSILIASAYRQRLEKKESLYYAPGIALDNVKSIRKVRLKGSLERELQSKSKGSAKEGVATEP